METGPKHIQIKSVIVYVFYHSLYSIPSGNRQVNWIDGENMMVEGLDPDALQYSSETTVELQRNAEYVFMLYAIEGTGVITAPDKGYTFGSKPGNRSRVYLCWPSVIVMK